MQTGVRWFSTTNLIHEGVGSFYYPDAELEPLTLPGPVAMVRTRTFAAFRSGKRILKGPRLANHPFIEQHAWYDRAGKMVKRCNCTRGEPVCRSRDGYVYDAVGRLIKWMSIPPTNGMQSHYSYPHEGKLIMERRDFMDGNMMYLFTVHLENGESPHAVQHLFPPIPPETYIDIRYIDADENMMKTDINPKNEISRRIVRRVKRDHTGRVTEGTWYDPDGSISSIMGYTYDEAGNQVEGAEYDKNMQCLASASFSYDPQGRIIEIRRKKSYARHQGLMVSQDYKVWVRHVRYAYDVHGNVTDEILRFDKPGLDGWGKLHYDYTYDDHGNWIRRVERISGYIDQDLPRFVFHVDKPTYITEREIRYHD